MKCPNCGAESNGRFCSYCGSELPYSGPQAVNSGNQTINSNNVTHNITNVYYVNQVPMASQVRSQAVPENYPAQQGQVYERYVQAAAQSDKNKSTLLVLCFLFGVFGVHHFYSGRWKMGLLYLLTGGLVGIGCLVDFILIASNKYKDAQGLPVTGNAVWGRRIIYLFMVMSGIAAISSSSTSDEKTVGVVLLIVFGLLFIISFVRKK